MASASQSATTAVAYTADCQASASVPIEGEAAACRDVAVCEFRGHTAVVDSDWKLEVDPDGEPVLLFDRRRDPAEQEDVLGDARHAGVVAALRERLAEHVAATPAPRERVATVER